MEKFKFSNGVAQVHDRNQCLGRYKHLDRNCAIHNPSNHHMIDWPMVLRESTLIERVCEHGIGHPDPDSLNYFMARGQDWMGIHGCDGCCGAPDSSEGTSQGN